MRNLAAANDSAAAAAAAARAALASASRRLGDLQGQFLTRSWIIARPTGYILSGATRQWEFQGMASAVQTPR